MVEDEDMEDETVASQVYWYDPAVVALVVSTLVLVALSGFSVVMLTPFLCDRVVPVTEGPLRHTKDFVPVTLSGTDAVHTMLKELYGAASSTVIVEGSVCTMRHSSAQEYESNSTIKP